MTDENTSTIRDKSARHNCLKRRFYQQTIISFCLNAVNPPILESLLFVVNDRLEGLIWGEEGRGYTGGEDRYVHYVKRGLFYEIVSTLLSLIVASIKDSAARPMANSKLIFREEPPAG